MTVRLYTQNQNAIALLQSMGFTICDGSSKPGFPYVEISHLEPSPDVLVGIETHLVDVEYELTARFQRTLRPTKQESFQFKPGQWIAVRKVKEGWGEIGEDPDTYEFTIRTTSVQMMGEGYRFACKYQ